MFVRFAQTIFVLLAFAIFAKGGPAAVSVEIHQNPVVSGEIVLVGDIADISGDSVIADKIRNASLGYSPRIGATRTIPLRKIKLVIAAAGIPQHAFNLRSPSVVYVRREGQAVSRGLVREEIEKALGLMFSAETSELRITSLEIPEAGDVPLGDLDVSVDFANIRNLFEPFSLPFEIRVDSKLAYRSSAQVEIEAYAEILTANKDIPANTRITADMLVPRRHRIVRPLTEYLTDPKKVRGIKSSREIRMGDPITRSVYLADIVIKTGDKVRITGVLGRMRLVVNGVAQAGGRIGDRIAVKNLQSNQIIQAIITDEGIVEVFF